VVEVVANCRGGKGRKGAKERRVPFRCAPFSTLPHFSCPLHCREKEKEGRKEKGEKEGKKKNARAVEGPVTIEIIDGGPVWSRAFMNVLHCFSSKKEKKGKRRKGGEGTRLLRDRIVRCPEPDIKHQLHIVDRVRKKKDKGKEERVGKEKKGGCRGRRFDALAF